MRLVFSARRADHDLRGRWQRVIKQSRRDAGLAGVDGGHGGDEAPHFNPGYHAWAALDAMIVALGDLRTPEAPHGYWSEPCTSWYTAIYRA